MKAVLILALVGQYCARPAVQQSYVNRTYAATTCNQVYAAPTYNQVYAVPYVEKVKFVAVENQPSYDYYAALAASASRNYERFQEYASIAPQPALTYSIPQPQPVALPQQQYATQQQVYQAPAPVKAAPAPQDPVYGTPQQQAYGTPQQPAYGAPAPDKTAPLSLQAPGAPDKNPYSGTPPPIIRQAPMNYSATMGGEADVPPPPVPRSPTAFNDSNKVIHSINVGFLSVLSKNCASCHTGQGSKGNFPIFEYPGRLANLTEGDLQNIYTEVAKGRMPFKRSISVADRQALLGMLRGNVSPVASR